ncbi:MAG: rhodanese-related sulfurtransferase [Bacteroidales bacterium]|nr:rhodanese-related sulfurtransferase [Bacteroidales bacterium]MCB9013900.1 rhodanese-related sulfurtransferase [Bacteroidales bacterium]
MILHNRINSEILKQQLMEEDFKRTTLSFYRYVKIDDPKGFRDRLYIEWTELNAFGRIYIAREGINAQMSVPEEKLDLFLTKLRTHEYLKDIQVRIALEDDGKSFFKLSIKQRPKIVADGLSEDDYDVSNVGTHLSALEFHELLGQPDVLVVDMRNHYESEIGHFQNAICPDADTFREELELSRNLLAGKETAKILLYCTGGIRCEKASAYLRHQGFSDVNQLHGGIIEYARQIKIAGLESRFIGKNFVFDNRLGERVTDQVISHCHQCGKSCDTHTNCTNDDCHLLFIQCDECRTEYQGCCSEDCNRVIQLPAQERESLRIHNHSRYAESKIFNRHHKKQVKQN